MTARRRRDEGQSTVELALVAPFAVLLALAVGQVAVVAHDQLLVLHAAREAARAAAVADDDPGAAAERAGRAAGALDGERLEVRTEADDLTVTASVVYRSRTDLLLSGWLLPDVELHARSSMRRESVP